MVVVDLSSIAPARDWRQVASTNRKERIWTFDVTGLLSISPCESVRYAMQAESNFTELVAW